MTGAQSPIDLTVVAPCHNEEQNLEELVVRLRATFALVGIAGQIVLVNDGSEDGTASVMERLASTYSEVTERHHERNLGIEAAWHTGVQAARGNLTCFIDADLQNQPEDIARLLDSFKTGSAHIVQGRRVPAERGSGSRYRMSRSLNTLLNVAFGMRLKDNKSGFILGGRDTIEKTLEHRFRYRYFQALLLVSAHAKGFRIAQVDTLFASRSRGTSFMSAIPVRVIVGCLIDVVKGVFEFRILRPPGNVALGT